MKAVPQIIAATLIWVTGLSLAESLPRYSQISSAQREAEVKKSLFYYNKTPIIPRSGSSGINRKSDSGNQEQTPAQDRLFFPPYVFPFWGLPYGIFSRGGFFNPGLFPFVPGGPGFPPYDGVFGGPDGPGQFPGPGPVPFPRPTPPPPPPPPAPSPPASKDPPSKADSSKKGYPSYYKRKPYKSRKPSPPVKPPKKEKEDCDCSSDDDDNSNDNRRAYYYYKRCKCKSTDDSEPEKKSPPKVLYKKGRTGYRKVVANNNNNKQPCKYGYRSGSEGGGCKPPPPPKRPSPPPEEEDEDEEEEYYPPPPKSKKRKYPKDEDEEDSQDGQDDQSNYSPMVVYQPVPYPVPASSPYFDENQQISMYQTQPSYYPVPMDIPMKQSNSQSQMLMQQYGYENGQQNDMGRPSMQNTYNMQQYPSQGGNSPLIIPYTPILNQDDGQDQPPSPGNVQAGLPRYPRQQPEMDSETQASAGPIMMYPEPMDFVFNGDKSYSTSGRNVPLSSGDGNVYGYPYSQMQSTDSDSEPQLRSMFPNNQDPSLSNNMGPAQYEIIYAAPTQSSMFKTDSQIAELQSQGSRSYRQIPFSSQSQPYNSNLRSMNFNSYYNVPTSQPVAFDMTRKITSSTLGQNFGINNPAISLPPPYFQQRFHHLQNVRNQNSEIDSAVQSSSPPSVTPATTSSPSIPNFSISTIIHMHNFTGSTEPIVQTNRVNPVDLLTNSDNSKVISTLNIQSDGKGAIIPDVPDNIERRMSFEENEQSNNHSTVFVTSLPSLVTNTSG